MQRRTTRTRVLGVAATVATCAALLPGCAFLARVSEDAQGIGGNGVSANPSLSADGRWTTFTSDADNLVAGDTNGKTDVFVRDNRSRTIARVSVASSGRRGERQQRRRHGDRVPVRLRTVRDLRRRSVRRVRLIRRQPRGRRQQRTARRVPARPRPRPGRRLRRTGRDRDPTRQRERRRDRGRQPQPRTAREFRRQRRRLHLWGVKPPRPRPITTRTARSTCTRRPSTPPVCSHRCASSAGPRVAHRRAT